MKPRGKELIRAGKEKKKKKRKRKSIQKNDIPRGERREDPKRETEREGGRKNERVRPSGEGERGKREKKRN